MLQCIRHIVQNNFYGIGASRPTAATSTQGSNSDATEPSGEELCKSNSAVSSNNNDDQKRMGNCYEVDEIWDDVKEDFS